MKEHEVKDKGGTWWIEDGVVRYRVEAEEYTEEMARDAIEIGTNLALKLEKGKRFMLVNFGRMTKQDPASRRMFGQDPRVKELDRIALVTSNPVHRVIGSFYMGISRPLAETKMFGSEEEAIKWLKS